MPARNQALKQLGQHPVIEGLRLVRATPADAVILLGDIGQVEELVEGPRHRQQLVVAERGESLAQLLFTGRGALATGLGTLADQLDLGQEGLAALVTDAVAEQLAEIGIAADILLEPLRRDSGPAIAAGALFAQSRGGDPLVVALAADHVVTDPAAFAAVCKMARAAADDGRIVTFGVRPVRAATEYGYIRPGDSVGPDTFGEPARELLALEGVDVTQIALDRSAATGVALIAVDAKGENQITVAPGANAGITPTSVVSALDALGQAAGAVLGSLEVPLDAVEAAARWAHDRGVPFVLNPAPARPRTDTVTPCTDTVCPTPTTWS